MKHFDTVKAFVGLWEKDSHEGLLDKLVTKDAFFMFESGLVLPVVGMSDMILRTMKPSFLDFKLSLIENSYSECEAANTAYMACQAEGTFTGKPFAPLGQPAINPTNKHVRLGVESALVRFDPVSNKISSVLVSNPADGQLGGPMGLYVKSGGIAPHMLPLPVVNARNEANVATVKEMYASFTHGDIEGIIKHTTDDSDWQWGEAQYASAVPWCGRFRTHDEIRHAFTAISDAIEVSKLQPTSFIPYNGNIVMVLLDITSKGRQSGKTTTVINCHAVWFNDNGKVVKYIGFSDTEHLLKHLLA
jgi:ketosteroid isomerase-like protein